MASRITELVIDAADPDQLAAFWCEVLGFVELDRQDGSVEIGLPERDPRLTIVFSPSRDEKTAKLRLHIDISPTDTDQDIELARLLAAGATKVSIGQTEHETWHVLADPEGNEFCLLRTRVQP